VITSFFGGGAFFANKNILEVGCGYAEIGGHFAKLGANVLSTDARREHLDVAKKRHPAISTAVCDLDEGFPQGNFDLVLHLGVLYHLRDPLNHLSSALQRHPAAAFVLETEVTNVEDPDFVLPIDEEGYDQAFNLLGGRPSTLAIEKVISSLGREFTRLTNSDCNSSFHTYDWDPKETKIEWRPGLRRLWFVRPRFEM
jgi:SAM-dependent methyltransferase